MSLTSVNGFAVTSSRMNYSRKGYLHQPPAAETFFMHFCESVYVCEQRVHELHRAHPPIATETLTTCHLLITHPSYRPHTHVHLTLPPKHPELALTFSNEKGETTRWLITAAEAARLWNSMLLFTSPPVAIMRRTLEGSPALRQLAGGPF